METETMSPTRALESFDRACLRAENFKTMVQFVLDEWALQPMQPHSKLDGDIIASYEDGEALLRLFIFLDDNTDFRSSPERISALEAAVEGSRTLLLLAKSTRMIDIGKCGQIHIALKGMSKGLKLYSKDDNEKAMAAYAAGDYVTLSRLAESLQEGKREAK